MKRKFILVAIADICFGVTLPGQNRVSDSVVPNGALLLEEAHRVSVDLSPDDRATVLTLLVRPARSVPRERQAEWAAELFEVSPLTQLPAPTQKNALVALTRVDAERASQLFTRQLIPPDDASEDTRVYAALELFPVLWLRNGEDSITTIENLAAWLGSTGEYPYAAVGKVIPELAKTDRLLGRKLFLDAVDYFQTEKKFPGSNRIYVDFLLGMSGIPHDDLFRNAVAKAVDGIQKSSPPPGQKGIRMQVESGKNTEVFSSEKDYLLYKLLPLIGELDPKWRDRILESMPSLSGRAPVAGSGGNEFDSGVVIQAADPAPSALRLREALDQAQIRRAMDVSKTDARTAFNIADAIATPYLRDMALASILSQYSGVNHDGAAATATKLEKRVDSMKASPAKVAIEVKLTDALFALNLESEAMTMSQKATDLGLEIFRLDRLSHPGKVAFAADAFDSLLDLADILGRRVDPATAAQQIREVRDDVLKACMLAIFGESLAGVEEKTYRGDAATAN